MRRAIALLTLAMLLYTTATMRHTRDGGIAWDAGGYSIQSGLFLCDPFAQLAPELRADC